MNYSKLNEGLDEYLQKYENTFYVSNLDMNINLIRKGNKHFDLFKMIGSDEINLKPQEKISGLETLNLVTEFLSELGGNYLYYFTRTFNEGNFDFHNIDEVDSKRVKNECGLFSYTVKFNGTIKDPSVIVHEFFHYLNIDNYKLAPIFSEFISIFMENKFLDFLDNKCYSREDIAKLRLHRYEDFSSCCNKLNLQSDFLNLKKKIGYLDDDSYDFISMYGEELNFPNLTKKYFTDILVDLDNKMKKKKNVEQAFNPAYTFRYYLGTTYSSYLLLQDDSLDKVLLLNDYLMQEEENTNIETAFKILGINKKDDSCFIEATNKYYQNEALIYKNLSDKKINNQKIKL